MKYIRTKDGEIYEVENPKPFSIFVCKPKHVEMLVCIGENKYEMKNITIRRSIGRSHWKTEIIKQANTIEELCDEFVCNEMFVYDKTEMEWLIEQGNDVYGAIWTDKGLIFIAKMNEKGELELL